MDTEVLSSELWYEKCTAEYSTWLVLNDKDSIARLSKGINSHLVLRFLTPDLVYIILLDRSNVIYMYLFVFCNSSLYILLLYSKVSPIIIWLFMSLSPIKSNTCIFWDWNHSSPALNPSLVIAYIWGCNSVN